MTKEYHSYDEMLQIVYMLQIKEQFGSTKTDTWKNLVAEVPYISTPANKVGFVLDLSMIFAEVDTVACSKVVTSPSFPISLESLLTMIGDTFTTQPNKQLITNKVTDVKCHIMVKKFIPEIQNIDYDKEDTEAFKSLLSLIEMEMRTIAYKTGSILLKKIQGGEIRVHGHNAESKGIKRTLLNKTTWNNLQFEKPDKAFFSGTLKYDGIVFSIVTKSQIKHMGRTPHRTGGRNSIIKAMQERYEDGKLEKSRRAEALELSKIHYDYQLNTIEKYISEEYKLLKQKTAPKSNLNSF